MFRDNSQPGNPRKPPEECERIYVECGTRLMNMLERLGVPRQSSAAQPFPGTEVHDAARRDGQ